MTSEVLINAGYLETRIALVEDGRLVDLIIEQNRRQGYVGNIFVGRAERVVASVGAAFVELGLERAGFLPASEARHFDGPPVGDEAPGISALVDEGQAVIVQVQKDAIGDKGAFLTSDLTLPGRYLVFGPRRSGVAVSARIGDEAERRRLIEATAALEGSGGFIVRTAAEGAAAEDLAADATELRGRWADIQARAQSHDIRPPVLLHGDLDPVSKALRDRMGPEIEAVLIDDGQAYAEAKRYAQAVMPDLAERLQRVAGGDVFSHHDVAEQILAALEPHVALPSGGHICIETTEALTAVDVNSGRHTSRRQQAETALECNLEAARAVALQIRLRGIGGIIVIDFIHLDEREHRNQVVATLEEAFATDPSPVRIGRMMEFGLVALTRRRSRETLVGRLSDACEHCEGAGRLPSVESVAAEVLRQAEREAPSRPGGTLALTVAPDVAALLWHEDVDLEAFGRRVGRQVEVYEDPELARYEHDLEIT
ncbi:MAG TPA: Rne/Rng family ribonuclease [Alphaproteobacteria bacterium]|nr:Rne/Rng family ribonuclease [Alphaproteobacteria bacterium]